MASIISLAHAADATASGAGSAMTAVSPAPTFSWGGYIEAVGLLFLLLAVMWLVLWCVRRFGKFSFLPRPGSLPRDALVMEAQMPIGPRKGLMVVRFLDKRLLLGVTERHISLLSECPATTTGNTKADHDLQEDGKFQKMVDEARQQMYSPTATSAGSAISA